MKMPSPFCDMNITPVKKTIPIIMLRRFLCFILLVMRPTKYESRQPIAKGIKGWNSVEISNPI